MFTLRVYPKQLGQRLQHTSTAIGFLAWENAMPAGLLLMLLQMAGVERNPGPSPRVLSATRRSLESISAFGVIEVDMSTHTAQNFQGKENGTETMYATNVTGA